MLRYLGSSWTTDDLFEQKAINREAIREFIHSFIKFGSTTLCDMYVVQPMTMEELEDCAIEGSSAVGTRNCVTGSADFVAVAQTRGLVGPMAYAVREELERCGLRAHPVEVTAGGEALG